MSSSQSNADFAGRRIVDVPPRSEHVAPHPQRRPLTLAERARKYADAGRLRYDDVRDLLDELQSLVELVEQLESALDEVGEHRDDPSSVDRLTASQARDEVRDALMELADAMFAAK